MNKKADKLNEAAKIYIKIGHFERFCECLILNGISEKKLKTLLKSNADQWERALAYAPAVSMDYWRALTLRYADYLAEKDDDLAGYYYIIGRDTCKVY